MPSQKAFVHYIYFVAAYQKCPYCTHSAPLNYGTVFSSKRLTVLTACWLIPPRRLWGCGLIITSFDLQTLAESGSLWRESHPSPLPTVWHSFAMQIFFLLLLWYFKCLNSAQEVLNRVTVVSFYICVLRGGRHNNWATQGRGFMEQKNHIFKCRSYLVKNYYVSSVEEAKQWVFTSAAVHNWQLQRSHFSTGYVNVIPS